MKVSNEGNGNKQSQRQCTSRPVIVEAGKLLVCALVLKAIGAPSVARAYKQGRADSGMAAPSAMLESC